MFLKLSSNKINNFSTIIINLIILAILLLLFSSCTAPRSIGNYKKLARTKSESNLYKEETKPLAIENKIEVNKKDFTFIPSDEEIENSNALQNSFKRLPTLREQMNTISEEQIRLNSEVEKINNDLNEIKKVLQLMSEDLSHLKNGNQPFAAKGPQVNNSQELVILSDEDDAKNNTKNNYSKVPIKRSESKQAPRIVKKPEPKQQQKFDIVQNQPNSNELIETAINDLNNKDYNSSIQKLKSILEKERNQQIISEANYYLGENYFRLQNYQLALNYYRKVSESNNSTRRDIAQAMVAESLIRLGEVNEAKIAYQELINKYPQSEFIPKARKMLQQL